MANLNLVTQNNKYGLLGDDEYSWLAVLADEDEEDDFDFDFDVEFDDESSSVTPERPGIKTKKRRIRDRRRIYAPRIVKRDIRRHYAAMFANVYNSLDTGIIASFFKTFAIPHMRVRKAAHLHLTTSPSFQLSFPQNVIGDIGGGGGGLQWTIMFFTVLKNLCPDNIMRVVSSQLFTRSDTSKTLLTMKIRVDFTRFHDVNPLLFTEGMFAASSGAQPTMPGDEHGGLHTADHIYRSEVTPAGYFKDKSGLGDSNVENPREHCVHVDHAYLYRRT